MCTTEGTRRNYLEGLVSTAGLITVTPPGKAHANSGKGCGPPEEVPPRKGDSVMGLTVDPIKPVRVGIIGLGNRGSAMTGLIDAMYPEKGEINAICDLVQDRVEETLSELQDGQNPETYSAGVSEENWNGKEAWREDNVKEMDDSWKDL